MPLRITIRNNGPFAVDLTSGELELVDHEGTVVPLPEGKTTITLCRCGASTRKPFCDGTHSKIGFKGANAAREAADAQAQTQAPASAPPSPAQTTAPSEAPQQQAGTGGPTSTSASGDASRS